MIYLKESDNIFPNELNEYIQSINKNNYHQQNFTSIKLISLLMHNKIKKILIYNHNLFLVKTDKNEKIHERRYQKLICNFLNLLAYFKKYNLTIIK